MSTIEELSRTVRVVGLPRLRSFTRARKWGWEGILRGYFLTRVLQTLLEVGLLDAMGRSGWIDVEHFAEERDLDPRLIGPAQPSSTSCFTTYRVRCRSAARRGGAYSAKRGSRQSRSAISRLRDPVSTSPGERQPARRAERARGQGNATRGELSMPRHTLMRLKHDLALALGMLLLLLAGSTAPAIAQPTPPRPDAGGAPNIFYGQTPAGGAEAPILVFVHGLRGHAADWWVGNDMYRLAFEAGYRTAFINLNADLTPNDAGVVENARVLKELLPQVAARFRAPAFYIVAHSKGGVDVQAALLDPAIAHLATAIFMISPPNHGSELADWAFGEGRAIAEGLGLLTPGVFAMKTSNMAAFRALADPVAASAGIPYFTMAGSTYDGNPLTSVIGRILERLTGGEMNDGLVTVSSTKLPESYATDLGLVATHHFKTNDGDLAFPRIHAAIQALEGHQPFERLQTEGFGDRQNSFAWSMRWFKGRLYVGTGRAFLCVTAATSDRQVGTTLYRPSGPDIECAPTPEDLPLAAEIWRYTPATSRWQRVFKSEEDVPIAFDALGQPTKFTARDVAFRGMVVHREADGTEALYVAGVTASAIFDQNPPYNRPDVHYPPPRILRTVDGLTWAPLSQEPGTFLGDIGRERPGVIQVRGFRSMESFRGKLFVTASDFRGVGILIASSNPAAGNDAWRQVSPSADELPIWTLHAWNGFLYLTTGDGLSQAGYGVYKTAAIGPGPYTFIPVVTQGAFQLPVVRSRVALSLMEFNGRLYVGSDRPTELIRINRDDTWELVVGGSRMTPDGFKRPISGLRSGFGNLFNGHFWRMATHDGSLYLGTWDWSIGLRVLPGLDRLFRQEYGFDFFTTKEGRYWRPVTKTGFGDPFNYGVRSLASTPAGLFLGTANPFYGLQVWRSTSPGDVPADPDDPPSRPSTGNVRAPLPAERLEAASDELTDGLTILTWAASKHADHYQIWRSVDVPVLDLLPPDFSFQIPGTDLSVGIPEIKSGVLDAWCRGTPTAVDCDLIEAIRHGLAVPGPFDLLSSTTDRIYVDPNAPHDQQSRYHVIAVDKGGNVSSPSNVVGGPSAAAPVTFETVSETVDRAIEAGLVSTQADLPRSLVRLVSRSASALAAGDTVGSQRWLGDLTQVIEHARGHAGRDPRSAPGIDAEIADDLLALVYSLDRNVWLVGAGHVSASTLLP